MSLYGHAACTAVEWCQTGRQGQVLASTMSRAQNRAAKGSTLFQRRATLPIWVYYFSMGQSFHQAFHHSPLLTLPPSHGKIFMLHIATFEDPTVSFLLILFTEVISLLKELDKRKISFLNIKNIQKCSLIILHCFFFYLIKLTAYTIWNLFMLRKCLCSNPICTLYNWTYKMHNVHWKKK